MEAVTLLACELPPFDLIKCVSLPELNDWSGDINGWKREVEEVDVAEDCFDLDDDNEDDDDLLLEDGDGSWGSSELLAVLNADVMVNDEHVGGWRRVRDECAIENAQGKKQRVMMASKEKLPTMIDGGIRYKEMLGRAMGNPGKMDGPSTVPQNCMGGGSVSITGSLTNLTTRSDYEDSETQDNNLVDLLMPRSPLAIPTGSSLPVGAATTPCNVNATGEGPTYV